MSGLCGLCGSCAGVNATESLHRETLRHMLIKMVRVASSPKGSHVGSRGRSPQTFATQPHSTPSGLNNRNLIPAIARGFHPRLFTFDAFGVTEMCRLEQGSAASKYIGICGSFGRRADLKNRSPLHNSFPYTEKFSYLSGKTSLVSFFTL